MSRSQPSLFSGLIMMRCPSCRKGGIFANKSIFPLKECLKMTDHCAACGQKMKFETNNGPGINYALTVILFFLNLCWYWPLFGLSYKDYSVYYFLTASTIVVVLLQPWLMRYSRVLYLYMFIKYGSGLQ